MCAERVPVAPAVAAVLPYLCHGGTGCGVLVICMHTGLVGGLLFAARSALLVIVGGLAFLVRVCLWCFPALVYDF